MKKLFIPLLLAMSFSTLAFAQEGNTEVKTDTKTESTADGTKTTTDKKVTKEKKNKKGSHAHSLHHKGMNEDKKLKQPRMQMGLKLKRLRKQNKGLIYPIPLISPTLCKRPIFFMGREVLSTE